MDGLNWVNTLLFEVLVELAALVDRSTGEYRVLGDGWGVRVGKTTVGIVLGAAVVGPVVEGLENTVI